MTALSALLVVGVSLALIGVATTAWRRRDVPGGRALAIMLVAATLWSLTYLGELAADGLAAKLLWVRIEYLGIVAIPFAWLAFALQYTGHGGWLTRSRLILVGSVPLATLLLVWTGDAHPMIWTSTALDSAGMLVVQHGPWFWGFTAFAYLCLAIGSVLLLRTLARSHQVYRTQAAALLISVAAPLVGNALYLFKLGPFSSLDPTPFAFAISGAVLGWSLLRLRLLSLFVGLIPVARDAVVEGMRDGVIVLNAQGVVLDLNPAAERVLDVPASGAIGRPVESVVGEWPTIVGHLAETVEAQVEFARGEGAARRHYDLLISPLSSEPEPAGGWLVVLRDITERKQAEVALRESERRYRTVVDSVNEVIFQADRAGRWRLLNPAWTAITGHTVADSLNTWMGSYVHADDRAQDAEQFRFLIEGHKPVVRYEVRVLRQDGEVRWMQVHARPLVAGEGEIVGTSGTLTDVTERKGLEEQLLQQAFQDPLTGLANRSLFHERVRHALTRVERLAGTHAVLFLDLDNFKSVNDSLGHAAGDELLREVAERLGTCVRSSDTVARLGGDEFAILLEDLPEGGVAIVTANRIQRALLPPFPLNGIEVFASASIGIAVCDAESLDLDTLMRNADIAMYTAKRTGRGRAVPYSVGMDATLRERLAMEADLHRALERQEFVVAYQPTVELATRRMTGVEALVRWRHPERGLVPPAQFIPLAEETGLILAIGSWVLRQACRQARAWQLLTPNAPRLSVAVNLSARQFQDPGLIEDTAAAIRDADLDPRCLTLEITESAVMQDTELTITKLKALKALGVRLAIDDFGTGYSSLSYLQRFPIDVLKIDRSFVSRIEQVADDAALAKMIVQLAQTLRLRTVAEGIETEEQLERLQALGCELGQGYYFARPLEPAEIAARLESMNGPLSESLDKPVAQIYNATT